jgi:hypothetical protein
MLRRASAMNLRIGRGMRTLTKDVGNTSWAHSIPKFGAQDSELTDFQAYCEWSQAGSNR